MIENGRLKGVRFVKANSSGGAIKPRLLCLHDTAGSLDKFSSVKWFQSKDCKTSAHFVVERDGTVTQMVETDKKAFHAGVSKWNGITGLNSCSIGIEIVNPGKMDQTGKAWFGKAAEFDDLKARKTKDHGDGFWLPYSEAHIAAVILICTAIVDEYPDCNEIVGHWQISPGRKIDPNPLFPWARVRDSVLDPKPVEIEEEVPQVPAPPPAIEKPPAQPSAGKEIAKEAAQSWTVRNLFVGFMAWIEAKFGFIRSALPDAQEQAESVVNPLLSLGGLLKVNMVSIAVSVATVAVVVAIYRHSRDKAELRKLKGEAT